MSELLKKMTDNDMLWIVAFVGVCVLVGVGKIKPETLESMLLAVAVRYGTKKAQDKPSGSDGGSDA